jgi:hypothetical protein
MPPASDQPGVVLHVGTGKTGTTSIQGFLRQNRRALGERGILFPRSPGKARHTKLGLSFRSDDEYDAMPAWHQMLAQSPERFRRRFHRRLLEEIAAARPRRVVFSDEALYTLPEEALRRLREFLDVHLGPVHLIAYLRRQDDHLVSFYQQQVKVGETRRLADFAASPGYPYDYAQRLDDLRAALRPATLTVRRFERSRFVDGVLEADFLDAAEIDGEGLERGTVQNESLDAASVEFLRLYNLHQVEYAGATVGVMDHRDLVRRIGEGSTGTSLALSEELRERFMAPWVDPNRAVAASYFGDTELFAESPRRRSVTETQGITTAELDDLMAVAGLPDDVRDRMRRIAERERSDG